MKPGVTGVADFSHFNSSRQKRICDQGAVAAPGHGFRAHHRNALVFREFDQIVQVFSKLRRLHVIRKTTEAGVMPACVDGVSPRVAEAAKSRRIPVVEASAMHCR